MSNEVSINALLNATVDLLGTQFIAGPATNLAPYTVDSIGLTTPPTNPIDGQSYVVGAGATGDWATHDNELAQWVGFPGFWLFVPVQAVMNKQDSNLWLFINGVWTKFQTSGAKNLDITVPTLTLGLEHVDCYLICTHLNGCKVTIPPQSEVGWPDAAEIHGRGVMGYIQFLGGVGVEISIPEKFDKEAVKGSAWTLKKEGVDKWALIGYLSESPAP